jgi:hypothetical protein
MDEEADRDSREDRKRSYDNEYNEGYDRGRVSQCHLCANEGSSCMYCMKAALLPYIIPVPHALTVLYTDHFIVVQIPMNQS